MSDSSLAIPQKSANADTPLDQFKLDSGHPHAIVIASRLHYGPVLLRLMRRDNTGNGSQWIRCDTGGCDYEHGVGLRNLFIL